MSSTEPWILEITLGRPAIWLRFLCYATKTPPIWTVLLVRWAMFSILLNCKLIIFIFLSQLLRWNRRSSKGYLPAAEILPSSWIEYNVMALGHRYDCKYPYFLSYIDFFLVKSGGLQSAQHGEQNNVGPSYPIRVLYSRSCTGSDPAPTFGPDEERTVYVRDNGTYWEVGSVIGLFIVYFQWKDSNWNFTARLRCRTRLETVPQRRRWICAFSVGNGL